MTAGGPARGACSNCGAVLTGPFCAACGQEVRPLDPSLNEILRDVGHELSDVDGRVLRSLRRLFSSPGFLTEEHFEGRRAAWLPPIRLYLVVSVVYFAVSSLTGQAGPTINIDVTGDTDEETLEELQRFGYSSDAELDRVIQDAEATWMPRAMFVLMPIFAGLVQLAQRRSGRKYPHHLIFALHAHTAWFGIFALLGLIGYLGSDLARRVLGIAAILYAVAYLAVAFRRVYGGTWPRAILQSVIVGGGYAIVTVLVTAAIVVPIVLVVGT